MPPFGAPSVPVEGNPLKSRTVLVPTGSAMEWSTRALDDNSVPIPGTSKIGLEIAFNTKTLLIYNADSTNGMAVVCLDQYLNIIAGPNVFPTIVNPGPQHDYMIVPAGGALTLAVGPVGERMLVPKIYVQSLTASTLTASFAIIQTSGNLALGGG